MVTVYTKPGCGPCIGTKRALESKGIEYQEASLLEPENLTYVQSLGYAQAPVVVAPDGSHWSGLEVGRIDALTA